MIDDALVERLRTDQVYLLARPEGHDAKNIAHIVESLGQAAAALEAAGLSLDRLREAEFKLSALRVMCDACSQPLYVAIIDEVLALLGGMENPPLDPTAD